MLFFISKNRKEMIELGEIKVSKKLGDINSAYVIKEVFSFLNEKQLLNMIIYNRGLQKMFLVNFEYYKRKSGKYRIIERNGKGREYILGTFKIIFEGEYENEKRNG